MTKIINFKDGIDEWELKEIKKSFEDGKLVIFPTETVYGIGANALDKTAVDSIFVAKGRAQDNPLIVHISNFEMLKDLVEEPSELEQKLIDAFMPGPFTLILKKKNIIPDNVTCGLDTVGIRFPENKTAQAIIEYTGLPIAAPSANISSRPSGTKIDDIKDEFDGKVDIIVDGDETKFGIESTVCKVIDGVPTILRPGKITPEDIETVIGKVDLDKHIFMNTKSNEKVESPGMKYKHYAPNTDCVLIYGHSDQDYIDLINEHKKNKTTIIGFSEHKDLFKDCIFHELGSKDNLEEIS
ncbi:MAG: threonylcarbamoyl-AMP synthase, partial [Bacilli bacterium]|nr:threonylcarbamoyl-AMP synthase [Bacilli bacterium]